MSDSMHETTANNAALAAEVRRLRGELEAWQVAFGLLTTLGGDFEIDIRDPLGMARTIERHVLAERADLAAATARAEAAEKTANELNNQLDIVAQRLMKAEERTEAKTQKIISLRGELRAMQQRAEAAEADRAAVHAANETLNRERRALLERVEAAEAVVGNMLNHLLPDTIRAIVLDLNAAEQQAPDYGAYALLPQTLEFRDKCAARLGAEWPSSAWDQEWCTALEAERSRRAYAQRSEAQPRGAPTAVFDASDFEVDESEAQP